MDSQFIKKLSLDVFGMEKLRISSVYGSIAHNANVQHERLDAEKLQFVRGKPTLNEIVGFQDTLFACR